MRVDVDLLKCESNGMCVATAPEVFALSDDDELSLLTESLAESQIAAVELAVRLCPKQALSLVGEPEVENL
jgi:ferredoxin